MTKILPLIGIVAALGAASPAASAAQSSNRAEAAMTKGIRDYARVAAEGATASKIVVDAKAVSDVGDKSRVTGTFRLTKNGRTAVYRLTANARVLRISPSAIEYKLAAKATKTAAGLPKSTGSFSGFFQGPAARESR